MKSIHAKKVKEMHSRYADFIEYGDTENFRAKLMAQRDRCRACEQGSCASLAPVSQKPVTIKMPAADDRPSDNDQNKK